MSSLEVRIVAGGPREPEVEAAIGTAVARILQGRERSRPVTAVPEWSRAARLEAIGLATVRSRAALPPA